MRKRITSLLLTLVMLLSLVPAMGVTASAADGFVEVSTYEQLKTAVDKGDAKVKLMANIDTTNENGGAGVTDQTALKFIGDKNILDLNGYTLKLVSNTGATFFEVLKSLTIKDSGTGGRIDFEWGSSVLHRTTAIHVADASTVNLTVESGTLSSTYDGVTLINSEGNLTIKGGKIQVPDEASSHDNAKAIYTDNSYGDNCKILISGGEISGNVMFTRDDSAVAQIPKGSECPIQISGGTFKGRVSPIWQKGKQPSEKITEYSPVMEISGGTFEGRFADRFRGNLPVKLTGGTFKRTSDFYMLETGPKVGMVEYSAFAESLGNSIIMRGNEIRTACYWSRSDWFYLDSWISLTATESDPITVIPNAWGMKSVTLDGNPIDYFKDWKGTVERMDNSTAHTLKFEWYPLAQELKDAGYTYQTKCEHYISGSTAVQQTDTIAADKTSHTVTIPAGIDPKVYSYDLQLNLQKDGSFVGIMSNEHIVKLVVSEAPVVEPDPTIEGNVFYYTSGIVYGSPISIAASVTPAEATKSYQWQRSTDGGSTWTNIEGATSGKYTPVAADMGENVSRRVKVTAEGYLGEIVGAALKVSKAANDDTPTWPDVVAQKDGDAYKKFEITNYNPKQEYVYTTSPISGSEWPDGGTKITSATVEELDTGSTYYIYTRYKETDTHTAGSKIRSSSVLVDEINKLNRIILTDESGKVYSSYGSGNTIYIKKGESMTLTAKTNPDGANTWSDFTFKSQYDASAPFSVTAPTASVTSGSTIPSVTIYGNEAGTGTLAAEYPGYPAAQSYGTWRVHVYENVSDIGTGAEITVSPSFPDMTMYQGETMPLPEYTVDVYPEGALENYDLAWRIIKVGMGAAYSESDENITLENDEIKATKKHTGSENTRIALVAINKGNNYISSLSSFYVTVTEAPTVELTGLTVAPAKVNLANVGDTYQLSAVKQPVNAAGSLTWASDTPAVAEVDTTGKVTAKAQGTAIITVTCGTKSASCTVTVGHTHDTDAQPWVYMDPGTHIKTCTAGDDFNVEAHDFNAWTPNSDDTTHSRTCSKCKKSGEPANYTETANHNWQWVVDTAATPNAAGKQHEECVDCHAKRSENTEIPMLTSIKVEHLTVAKPVKDAAATAPTTTDSAYTVANTEWMAADGTPLAIGGKFQPGTVYTVKITLETAGAGVFSVKSTYNTIAGKTATVSPNLTGDNHADSVILTYTFDKTAGGYHPGTGTGTGVTTYSITVKSAKNGDVTASHKSASKGTTVTLTVDPDKGYVLDTLTVLDGKDKEIKLTEKNGKYTFTMPAGKVTVEAMFEAEQSTGKNPFTDVPAGSYYEDAVIWAVEKGITTGTGNGRFSPDAPCTRAQIVTFLWRAAGSPAPKSMSSFSDVPAEAFYAKAVAWAVEKGITSGTGDGKFSPDATCTRAQAVTFLYRASGAPAVSGNSAFTDVAADAYYAAAVTWAEKNGVTGGIGGGLFGSNNNCTRAQIVTFLYRSVK